MFLTKGRTARGLLLRNAKCKMQKAKLKKAPTLGELLQSR